MTQPLHLSGICLSYPGSATPVLAGLDLTVEAGSLTTVLGASGAGKTSLLKMVAGLLQPDAGAIRLGERSLLPLAPEHRKVVLVFQSPLLFSHLTVAQNVGFGLRMRGLPPGEIAARTGAMLERLRLTGLGNRRPDGLSGGQAQRVALARALVLEPELLLLDEPLSSLDPGLRDDMRSLIRTQQRELGLTTLVVTHDQAEAVVLSDKIAVIQDGRIAQHAAPAELFERPATAAVAGFFGGENFLPGQALGGVFYSKIGALKLGAGTPDGPGVLTIRPEAIILGAGSEAKAAQVVETQFLGTQSRVVLDMGGARLVALTAPDRARTLHAGQSIGVSLPAAALWVLPPESPPDSHSPAPQFP